jgi:GNAT superfamily N-acetyltransferase
VLHRSPTRDVATVDLRIAIATEAEAAAIAGVRNAAAEGLTREHGRGHWSAGVTERGVLFGMKSSRLLIAREGPRIVATLRLATKKPWAIDPAYFVSVRRPLYLVDMAVEPGCQRRGLGRLLVEEAKRSAQAWPADALRLDAYDSAAGAGPFYAKCGFREVGRVVYRNVPLIYYEWLAPRSAPATSHRRETSK